MRRVMTIISTVFFLATFCTIALGDVVPGAVLYLNARDNPAHPDAWTNLGTAGGELPAVDTAPKLEEGRIKFPDTGIDENNVKHYTATGSNQTFGGPPDTNPDLFLKDWTIEFLCKRNGDPFDIEHGLAGFRPGSNWQKGIFVLMWAGWGDEEPHKNLCVRHAPIWAPQPGGIKLVEGEWTWIAFTGDKNAVVAYKNGEEVARDDGWTFDKNLAVDGISIFAQALDERQKTFNGSFAIFRVYDKVLSADEIKGNIKDTWLAVDPASKLTTTWGREKTRY
jgi:hypothetical protein